MQFLVLVLVMLMASNASSQHVYYVKTDASPSSACPAQPCLTLDQYSSQPSTYFTTGATFMFLAGNHSILTPIILKNVFHVAFRAEEADSVTVSCRNHWALQCEEVANLTIEGFTFKLQGDDHNHSLGIFNSRAISFTNLTFQGNSSDLSTFSSSGALYCKNSEIAIVNCLFTGCLAIDGGAVSAYESRITLDGNVFIQNQAVKAGGAIFANKSFILLKETLGNTFTNNSAMVYGGALFCFNSSIVIERDNLTKSSLDEKKFADSDGTKCDCTNTLQEQRRPLPVHQPHVHTTYFSTNKAKSGGAMFLMNNSEALLDGTSIIFHNNSAVAINVEHLTSTEIYHNESGGAMALLDSVLSFGGIDIFFRENVAHSGEGGAVFSWGSRVTSKTKHLCFTRNMAAGQGGAYCGNESDSSFGADETCVEFHNNSAHDGGALRDKHGTQTFKGRVLFVNNHACGYGGGLLVHITTLLFSGPATDFVNNSADRSAGVHLEYSHFDSTAASTFNVNGNHGEMAIRFILSNVTFSGDIKISRNNGRGISATWSSIIFKGNYTVFEENIGGAIEINKTTILFSGYVLFNANSADYGGAIYASDRATCINFAGKIHFTANWARSGGAMYFDNGASMFLKQNVKLTSSNNYASEHGGAIYNKDAVTQVQCNFLMPNIADIGNLPSCFIDISIHSGSNFPYEITSHNDSAKQGGNFLYGGLLDKCQVSVWKTPHIISYLFYPLFVEHFLKGDSHSKLITSEAYLLCFCESSQKYNCSEDRSVETYRGRRFSVPLLALAEGNMVTSTPLRAKLSSTARLKPNQKLQYLSSYCTNMSYNLYSSEEQEQLIVYPDNGPCLDTGLAQAVINLTFLPCPDAFTLSGDQCVCEERLQTVEAICTIFDDNFYITRKAGSKFWVSALTSNGTYHGLILCQTCPVMYCKTESINISLAEPDVQCDHNHSGVLCGACVANYSLMLGSSVCQVCSNTHLALLLPFAAAGIALVVFLSLLRLTVATGMINSIILYANIVQANRNLLFPTFTDTNVLTVFIAWMNLDLGFQTCFYHGMDAYAQTWLQFAFPVYVWIIIACMIVTSRYSVTVTKLIGTNPIAVLATLLLMSYNKILKITIEVYSSVELEYPGNVTSNMWLKDANVPYLQSKHLALMVVTTLVVVFFFLPYTLLLLLGYKLYRFTGRRHTRWLIRIKPLLDSYYAPYEMHTRYWTGFLLLVRCALYIVFSYDSLNHTTKSLDAIIMGFTALATIAWLSVKIYTNFYTNVIEALVYLDLVILSTATLTERYSPLLANLLVGIVFAIMMGIIVYHFHILYTAKSAFWLKMLTFFTREEEENHPAATEVSPLLCASVIQPEAKNARVMLREPLLTEN